MVTCPTSSTATLRRLASTASCWAHSRTWVAEPGEEATRSSAIVWMLSTSTSSGATSSIAATTPRTDVSEAIHTWSMAVVRRRARPLTCCWLSSALTYSTGAGHPAASCIANVLLPMPGSPPSSVTDPGTSPPPSTRSSSATPVGRGAPSEPSTSARRQTGARGRSERPGSPASATATVSSTIEFHAPHPAHCPDHLAWVVPHSTHASTVRDVPTVLMARILTQGCHTVGRRATGGHQPDRASRGPAPPARCARSPSPTGSLALAGRRGASRHRSGCRPVARARERRGWDLNPRAT